MLTTKTLEKDQNEMAESREVHLVIEAVDIDTATVSAAGKFSKTPSLLCVFKIFL